MIINKGSRKKKDDDADFNPDEINEKLDYDYVIPITNETEDVKELIETTQKINTTRRKRNMINNGFVPYNALEVINATSYPTPSYLDDKLNIVEPPKNLPKKRNAPKKTLGVQEEEEIDVINLIKETKDLQDERWKEKMVKEMNNPKEIDSNLNLLNIVDKNRVKEGYDITMDEGEWPNYMDKFEKGHYINCDLRYFNLKQFRGEFDVVSIDPPWKLKSGQAQNERTMFANCTFSLPYHTLTNAEIMDIDVGSLSKKGFIFLWTIKSQMEFAFACMNAWGYTYVDMITWVKTTHKGNIGIGQGFYFLHTTEICLIGVKNDKNGELVEFISKPSNDVLFAGNQSNSEKPKQMYHLIERMMPGAKKIELFARNNCIRPGWFSLGNELGSYYAWGSEKWGKDNVDCDYCKNTIETNSIRYKSRNQKDSDVCEECLKENNLNREDFIFIPNEMEEMVFHDYYSCTLCGVKPIWGVKYTCSQCRDVSLCENCYDDRKIHPQKSNFPTSHQDNHNFEANERPELAGGLNCHRFRCVSCLTFPIIGNRFRCKECPNTNFCQKCHFLGKTPKNHLTSHQMELLSAPDEGLHYSVKCDICYEYPIQGTRYKCESCFSFDLCKNCFLEGNIPFRFNHHKGYHKFSVLNGYYSDPTEIKKREYEPSSTNSVANINTTVTVPQEKIKKPKAPPKKPRTSKSKKSSEVVFDVPKESGSLLDQLAKSIVPLPSTTPSVNISKIKASGKVPKKTLKRQSKTSPKSQNENVTIIHKTPQKENTTIDHSTPPKENVTIVHPTPPKESNNNNFLFSQTPEQIISSIQNDKINSTYPNTSFPIFDKTKNLKEIGEGISPGSIFSNSKPSTLDDLFLSLERNKSSNSSSDDEILEINITGGKHSETTTNPVDLLNKINGEEQQNNTSYSSNTHQKNVRSLTSVQRAPTFQQTKPVQNVPNFTFEQNKIPSQLSEVMKKNIPTLVTPSLDKVSESSRFILDSLNDVNSETINQVKNLKNFNYGIQSQSQNDNNHSQVQPKRTKNSNKSIINNNTMNNINSIINHNINNKNKESNKDNNNINNINNNNSNTNNNSNKNDFQNEIYPRKNTSSSFFNPSPFTSNNITPTPNNISIPNNNNHHNNNNNNNSFSTLSHSHSNSQTSNSSPSPRTINPNALNYPLPNYSIQLETNSALPSSSSKNSSNKNKVSGKNIKNNNKNNNNNKIGLNNINSYNNINNNNINNINKNTTKNNNNRVRPITSNVNNINNVNNVTNITNITNFSSSGPTHETVNNYFNNPSNKNSSNGNNYINNNNPHNNISNNNNKINNSNIPSLFDQQNNNQREDQVIFHNTKNGSNPQKLLSNPPPNSSSPRFHIHNIKNEKESTGFEFLNLITSKYKKKKNEDIPKKDPNVDDQLPRKNYPQNTKLSPNDFILFQKDIIPNLPSSNMNHSNIHQSSNQPVDMDRNNYSNNNYNSHNNFNTPINNNIHNTNNNNKIYPNHDFQQENHINQVPIFQQMNSSQNKSLSHSYLDRSPNPNDFLKKINPLSVQKQPPNSNLSSNDSYHL